MNRIVYLLSCLLVFLVAGCGGGGSGGGGSNSGSSAAIFITDDLRTGYDHVWVTIKKVELAKVAGGTTVVFNDSTGLTVDLRTLRDAQGRRFKFISMDDGLSGQYNGVTVTLDDDVTLFTTGSANGLARTFEGSVGGEKTLTASFPAQSFGSGNDDFLIDFDLSTWNENGSQVTDATIKVVTDNSINDDSRHDRENYPGTVSDLQGTAPNQSFRLTRGSDSMLVQCDANTRIDRSGGNGNPVLANGLHVVVRGAFNVDLNRLDAERVKITGNQGEDHDEAFGSVSNLNGGAGTLDLSVINVDGFLPAGDPIHVTTTGSTVFRNRAGGTITKDEFFALLVNGDLIEAEGTYDAGSNTLTATKLKFEDGDGGGDGDEDNAEITGASSNVDAGAFTFSVTATEFSGLNVPPGTVIPVTTNGDTKFRGLSGNDLISKADFFTALTTNPGQLVEVEGHWDGSALVAHKAKLED